MKGKMKLLLAVMLSLVFFLPATGLAAPSLDIRHVEVPGEPFYPPGGPVHGGPNGPTWDSYSTAGQWFKDSQTEGYEYRTHEFYDNRFEDGGSEAWSTRAINGRVLASGGDTFTVRASITNDTPWGVGEYLPGSNDHDEYWVENHRYEGTMYDVKLTTEFAVTAAELDPSRIEALGYDQLAWYCDPDTGSFSVPTYDFGDIGVGETAVRDLTFGFDPVAYPELLAFLEEAEAGEWDIFSNRTTSLKISEFIESLTRDDGTAYPVPLGLSSDVSVFHNVPVPAALYLLGSGLVALAGLKRSRRKKT